MSVGGWVGGHAGCLIQHPIRDIWQPGQPPVQCAPHPRDGGEAAQEEANGADDVQVDRHRLQHARPLDLHSESEAEQRRMPACSA